MTKQALAHIQGSNIVSYFIKTSSFRRYWSCCKSETQEIEKRRAHEKKRLHSFSNGFSGKIREASPNSAIITEIGIRLLPRIPYVVRSALSDTPRKIGSLVTILNTRVQTLNTHPKILRHNLNQLPHAISRLDLFSPRLLNYAWVCMGKRNYSTVTSRNYSTDQYGHIDFEMQGTQYPSIGKSTQSKTKIRRSQKATDAQQDSAIHIVKCFPQSNNT